MRPIGWFAILLVVSMCTRVSGHGGRTDARGGHYNRRTGEYHYHSGGVSLSRTASRDEAPTQARTSARTTSRTSPPSIEAIASLTVDTRPIVEDSQYKVLSKDLTKSRPKIVVRLLVANQDFWTAERLEAIAKEQGIVGRAVVYFFLPDMELEERPWATVVQDTRGALKTNKFD